METVIKEVHFPISNTIIFELLFPGSKKPLTPSASSAAPLASVTFSLQLEPKEEEEGGAGKTARLVLVVEVVKINLFPISFFFEKNL